MALKASRALPPSSRQSIWVVIMMLSLTNPPTGSAFLISRLYFSMSGMNCSGAPKAKQRTPRPWRAANSNVPGLPAATHSGGCGFVYGLGRMLRSGMEKKRPS